MAASENDFTEPAHFTYIWTIENMCYPFYLLSPIFTVKEMDRTKWLLAVNFSTSALISVGISRQGDGPDSIEIKFELSFLGMDGVPLIKKVGAKMFQTRRSFTFSEFADKRDVLFHKRAQFLPKNSLTIRCRMWRTGTEISKSDMCFARTRLGQCRHVFVWAIRKFSTLLRNQERKVRLKMNSVDQITLSLSLSKNKHLSIETEVSRRDLELRSITISLLNSEGKVQHIFESHDNFYECFFKSAKLMEDKESMLPNDVLTLRCEIEVYTVPVWSVIESYRHFNSISFGTTATNEIEITRCEQDETSNISSTFTEAMKSLIEEGTLSDVSLRAGSKSFPAHKCILSARSPVFKAMFSGDMKEKTSKCVEIPDVNEDTLRELLSYIYTDKVGELEWRGVADLYSAADKYELLDLKGRCATFLKSDLSVSSVCVVLVVADMYHDRKLFETAQDFVVCQGEEFFTSDTWRIFKEENFKLYVEILERIVCSKKSHR